MRFLAVLALAVAVTAQLQYYSNQDDTRDMANTDADQADNDVDFDADDSPTPTKILRRNDYPDQPTPGMVNYNYWHLPIGTPKVPYRLSVYPKGYDPKLNFCQGPGFSRGQCQSQSVRDKVCMQFPDWKTLSAAPDLGIQCKFFSGPNCDGTATRGDTVLPGVPDFNGYQGLNGAPRSYQCKVCDDKHTLCGGQWVGAGPW